MDSKIVNSRRVLSVFLKNKRCILSTITGCSFIVLAAISIIVDPIMHLTRYCLRVDHGSYIYTKLQDKVDTVFVKMYLFNVTNADRFMSGADRNLKVQEVGPFTFRESRVNLNMDLIKEKRLLRYTPNASIIFVPEESVADPKDVTLVVPNVVFLSIASKLSRDSFLLKNSFNLYSSWKRLNGVQTITADKYMWGYNDPWIDMGKFWIPGEIFYNKIGLLSYAYDPRRNVPIEVETTHEEKFKIKTINGIGGITALGYESNSTKCNTFENTYEGWLFPTYMTPDLKIRMYHKLFCRILDMEYVQNKILDNGWNVLEYRFSRDMYDTTTTTDCLCGSNRCLKGLTDLSSCISKLPYFLSNAHFLDAEESVFDRLEGLKPDRDLHESQFLIHKDIGLTVNASFSFQINVIMDDTSYSAGAKPFSKMVVPITWLKIEQTPIPEDIIILLKYLEVYIPRIMIAIQFITFVVGILLLSYPLRVTYKSSKDVTNQIEYCTTMSPLMTQKYGELASPKSSQ